MISFNPPLNETTILNVPFHAGHLTFTVTVTPGQLNAQSTIQIWSDIPDNNQPPPTQGQQQAWIPRSFQFHKNASVGSLSIPFQNLIHPFRSQFSFTYRILLPDGRIQWLGEYGKNGSLIVNRYDDRFVLFGDWTSIPHGHSFPLRSAIKSPLQVFNLSDKVQWRCWDFSNSSPKLLSVNHGPAHIHSALFIPSQPKAAIIPLSPILLTSQDVQVTIHPDARSVYITSPSRGGQLSLQTLSPDALISSLTTILPSLISIPDSFGLHAILLANPDRAPARLSVVPLSPDSSASVPLTHSLPLSPILSHLQFLSDASSSFSISKPTRFISTSAKDIQLTVLDFGGAQFSLSPVYDLSIPDGDVRFSLLAKHNRIPTPTSHNLLTPPPSPPMTATETETQPFPPTQEDNQSHVPLDHLVDPTSQSIESPLTSGQSTPNPAVQEQLTSGQTTPKPRTAAGSNSPDPIPSVYRPVQRAKIRKLANFVLRTLLFFARILSKIIFSILIRLFAAHAPNEERVAPPKVGTIQWADDKAEVGSTPVPSAAPTPHSGASTPRNDPVDPVPQEVPGVTETLEPAEEGKSQGDLGGSYVQEPNPGSDVENDKSGRDRDGEWEVVHRPGILFELAPLPTPPAPVEGEALPKIKPLRLTLGGEESVVKGVKLHLGEVELVDVKIEPLTGTGQDGLWTVEIPRASRDLMALRVS